jgi:L-ascorbate metabolism protein UlaG (beta-lactamase superfamily)
VSRVTKEHGTMSRLGMALTWLGHSGFHLQPEPDGPAILIDPWLDNPKAPKNAEELVNSARIILLTHAHFDHMAGTAELVRRTGATVMTSFDMVMELRADGVPEDQSIGFNKGGSATAHGVTVTLVQAFHSSAVAGPDGRPRSVGDPCGLVIELPNGTVIYDTGDTCVFGDMALIAELYRPSVLLLPIGDFFTMGPRQAAKACELVQPQWIVPHHYGTFPLLPGTPDALRKHLPVGLKDRVLAPEPGATIR